MTKSWTQHITLTKRINNHFWIALEYWMVNSAILLRGKTSSPSWSLLHRVHNSQAVTTNNSTVWGWLRIRATKSEKEPWAVLLCLDPPNWRLDLIPHWLAGFTFPQGMECSFWAFWTKRADVILQNLSLLKITPIIQIVTNII